MGNILIIDDERSMLEFLEYLLRKEGYQVTLSDSGAASLGSDRAEEAL